MSSAQPHFPAMPPVRLTDQRGSAALTAVAWGAALLTFFYMLPWAIAATRGKSNHGAIALVNVLLGWTFIGWIVALVMACGAHQQIAFPFNAYLAAGPVPPSQVPAGPAPG